MSDRSAANSLGERYDVVILGGGLSGLTLALQLKRERPATTVFVAEKRAGDAPEAAFKVGESTSESGAHYFRHVLDLADHLDGEQLRKFGLRFFFPAGDNSDIAARVEYSTPPTTFLYAYQLDRGRLENELARRCRDAGVEVGMGSFIDGIEIGDDVHTVTLVRGGPRGDRSTVSGRWLVDASGRSGLLKRKLGFERLDTGHHVNSAWFRLRGHLDVEDWSNDEEWLGRMPEPGYRKHSTSHLAGEGYWIWIINLASGFVSIGISADPRFHPFDEIDSFDKLLEWFRRHEPQMASFVEERLYDVRKCLGCDPEEGRMRLRPL